MYISTENTVKNHGTFSLKTDRLEIGPEAGLINYNVFFLFYLTKPGREIFLHSSEAI